MNYIQKMFYRKMSTLEQNKYPLLALSTLFFVIYKLIFDHKLAMIGDNAAYYILGESLITGHGYSKINVPGIPPENHFPPGYPILISLAMLISKSFAFIKTVSGLFLFLSTNLLYIICNKITQNKTVSFIITIFALINTHILQYSCMMMSEIPFLFFTLLTLYFILKIDFSKTIYKSIAFWGMTVTLIFSYYIRSQGIALLGGIALFFVLKKEFKTVLLTLGSFLIGILPWYLRTLSLGGNSYMNQLTMKNPYRPELGTMDISDWIHRISENIIRYWTKEIPSSIFPKIQVLSSQNPLWYHYLLSTLVILLCIYGIVNLKKYKFLFIGYLGGQFAIQLLWPSIWFGPRFMIPIIPIILFLSLWGAYIFVSKVTSTFKNKNITLTAFGVVAIALLFFYYKPLKNMSYYKDFPYPNKVQNYIDAANWTRVHTPKDAVIACRKPNIFYLISHRKSFLFRNLNDPQRMIDDLSKKGTTHVVIDQLGYASTKRYLVPTIKCFPYKFKTIVKLAKSPKFPSYILSFNKEIGYFGPLKDNKKEGYGKMIYLNGEVFEGKFKEDQRNGIGTYYFKDGSQWKGSWKDDMQNGEGKVIRNDTLLIHGIWKDSEFIRYLN